MILFPKNTPPGGGVTENGCDFIRLPAFRQGWRYVIAGKDSVRRSGLPANLTAPGWSSSPEGTYRDHRLRPPRRILVPALLQLLHDRPVRFIVAVLTQFI